MKDVQLLSEVYIKEIAVKSAESQPKSFRFFGMFMAGDNANFWKNFVLSTTSSFDNTEGETSMEGVSVKIVDEELFDILQHGIEKFGKAANEDISGSKLRFFDSPEKLFLTNEKQDKVIFLDLEWNYATLYLR